MPKSDIPFKMSPNVLKIFNRNPCLFSTVRSYMKPENHHFSPSYIGESWKVELSNPIHCDFCDDVITGNGSYAYALFIFDSSGTIKICCSLQEHTDPIWDFFDQIWNERFPIKLSKHATLPERIVYDFYLTGNAKYSLMRFTKIDWETIKDECNYTGLGGNTWNGPEGAFLYSENGKLSLVPDLKRASKPVCELTHSDIVKIVNKLIVGSKFEQLSLF